MSGLSIEKQQKLYDALKKIARDYDTPERLRKRAEKDYGVEGWEAVEMAYDNIQILAADAIRGVRRPIMKAEGLSPNSARDEAGSHISSIEREK